jgi:polyisoprenoid-binding protein YceI
MWKSIAALTLLLATTPALAQTVQYDKSQVTSTATVMGGPAIGSFKKFTASVEFDPAKPDAGKATIEIDTASFDIGMDDMNSDAKTPTWFDTAQYPKAQFVSSGVSKLGEGRYEALGKLTLKGVTKDVKVPFTYKGGVFEGVLPIKRLDYNIGTGRWQSTAMVADEVQIKFRITLSGKK